MHRPATSFIQRAMVGFETTGEICSIKVNEDNTIEVSFLEDTAISLVSINIDKINAFVGKLKNGQVLVVEHYQGEINSVTQTIYDESGNLVYGKSKNSEYIKECGFFPLTSSEKLTGEKNCGKK